MENIAIGFAVVAGALTLVLVLLMLVEYLVDWWNRRQRRRK